MYPLKNIFILLFFIDAVIQSNAQDKTIRLILRGDDMGYTHSGNLALIKCYRDGIEKSIEVLVPSPWFPEAVKLLKQNPGADVGIHLALTSEWENIKWRPISGIQGLADSNGYMYPMVVPNKDYPGQSLTENHLKLADIEKEFRAQIELGKKLIPQVSHISSHMFCTGLNNEVKALAKKLAIEYKIDIDLDDYQVKNVGYDGPTKTGEEKIQSFINMLSKLTPGNTYMFLDHPGFDDAELKAVWHIGYEQVSVDRQGVTELFTSEKVKNYIKEKGIVLISYKDLLTKKQR